MSHAGWGVGSWLRYMDDGVAWSNDKKVLRRLSREVEMFLGDDLGLELKREPVLQRVRIGMDFLGMRLYPDRTVIAKTTRKRIRRKMAAIDWAFMSGRDDEGTYGQRLDALFARMLWPEVHSRQFRDRLLKEHRARVAW